MLLVDRSSETHVQIMTIQCCVPLRAVHTVSVRGCWGWPAPADPPRGTAEALSHDGGTSGNVFRIQQKIPEREEEGTKRGKSRGNTKV